MFWLLILSYRDKRTRDFAAGKWVKALSGVERSARLKLDRLEAAASLKDLAALPGNRFEALAGDRNGQYSIRVNDQWRVCFEWPARELGLPTWRSSIITKRRERWACARYILENIWPKSSRSWE